MPDAQGNPLPGEEGYVEPVDPAAPTDPVEPVDPAVPVDPVSPAPPTSSFEGNQATLDSAQDGYSALANQVAGSETGDYTNYTSGVTDIETIQNKTGGAEQYMTPETTVAGQLERLLAKDSALEQQSRAKARGQASALGMLSSSSAIGATRRASIEALTPVAAKDAETAKQFQQQKQNIDNEIAKIQVEAEVSGDLTVQKAKITEESKRIDQEWQALMTGMDAETKTAMQNLQGSWQEKMTNLEADLQREFKQMDIDAGVEQMLLNQSHESVNNYQITIQQLLANDSFLDNFAGDKEAMYGVFNDLWQTVESDIRLSARTAGVYDTVAPYIEELAEANEW